MTTAYTSLLGLALPVTGELQGTWGDTVNNSITSLLDAAVAGTTTLSTDADVTLTTTTGAANQARQAIILWTAGGTATRTITVPAQSKIYTVINKTSSTQSIQIVGVGPTTGVTIPAGRAMQVAWNGSDFVDVSDSFAANGTANGVVYLNGSKVPTTGSALTFSGSQLAVSYADTAYNAGLTVTNTTNNSASQAKIYVVNNAGDYFSIGRNSTALGSQSALFSTGAYPLQFYTNSNLAMTLDSAGNLGLGVNPATKLHIYKSSFPAEFRIESGDTQPTISFYSDAVQTPTRNWAISSSFAAYGDLCFQQSNALGGNPLTAGTTRMTLDASGRLLVGLSSSIASNGIAQIGGNADTRLIIDGSSTQGIYFTKSGADNGTYRVDGSGNFNWFVKGSGSANMTLDASGRLLIGATADSSGGPVQARINGTGTSFQTNPAVYSALATVAGREIPMIYASDGTNAALISQLSGNMAFFTQATERMRIDTSGRLLVGCNATDSGAQFRFQYGSGQNGLQLFDNSGASGSTFAIFAINSGGNSNIGSISRVGATSAVIYNTTSDYRLKTVTGSVTGAGERIDALNPVDYQWKDGGTNARGFLAHEFQEIYPSSVTGSKDAVDSEGKPVYQAMQPSTPEVIADLVAEIQSLRKRLAALEAK